MLKDDLKSDLDLYRDFARPHYARKDPAHDFRHIERILDRLDPLSQEMPPPQKPLLYFLACFHGLEKTLQADATFRGLTTRFLLDLDWTKPETDVAFHSLNRHLVNPRFVEEKIVHDANFVELLGAFGVAKAFTVGGSNGQSFEETVEIFEQYLNTIKFYTPVGQRLAGERKAYTIDFLQRLRTEW